VVVGLGKGRNELVMEFTLLPTIKFMRISQDAVLPAKAHFDDACFDLYASENRSIWGGRTAIVCTGFNIAIPEGYVGLVCSRSGLSANKALFVLNAPGVIDAGYRGELKVILYNLHERPFEINVGDRIAQLMLQKVPDCMVAEVESFEDITTRGVGGFGSTGQ
jgi:dUTP pyrophosphatase